MQRSIARALALAIQALSEKYDVSRETIAEILSNVPEDVLRQADWRDLDAIVQEGLAEGALLPGEGEEEEDVLGSYRL